MPATAAFLSVVRVVRRWQVHLAAILDPNLRKAQGTTGPIVRLFGALRFVPFALARRRTDGRGLPLEVILPAGNLATLPKHCDVVPLFPTSKLPLASIATPYGASRLWVHAPFKVAAVKITAGVIFCERPAPAI